MNKAVKDYFYEQAELFDKGFWEYIEEHYDEIQEYIEKKYGVPKGLCKFSFKKDS